MHSRWRQPKCHHVEGTTTTATHSSTQAASWVRACRSSSENCGVGLHQPYASYRLASAVQESLNAVACHVQELGQTRQQCAEIGAQARTWQSHLQCAEIGAQARTWQSHPTIRPMQSHLSSAESTSAWVHKHTGAHHKKLERRGQDSSITRVSQWRRLRRCVKTTDSLQCYKRLS